MKIFLLMIAAAISAVQDSSLAMQSRWASYKLRYSKIYQSNSTEQSAFAAFAENMESSGFSSSG